MNLRGREVSQAVQERILKHALNQSRRLSKDYERLPQSSEAMIYLSMTRLMLRRLTAA